MGTDRASATTLSSIAPTMANKAGSKVCSDSAVAARLLASHKDRHEQRIALDDMVARLETVAHQIRSDPQPHVLTLARIQHLETEIRASVPAGTSLR